MKPTRSDDWERRGRPKGEPGTEDEDTGYKRPDTSEDGTGYLTRFARSVGLQQDAAQEQSNESVGPWPEVENLAKANEALQQQLQNCWSECAVLERENGNLRSKLQQARHVPRVNKGHINEAISTLQAEVQQANARSASLQKKLIDCEEKLSKSYTTNVSTLARDVSRDVSDDMAKNYISTFFQGDFFSWCADMCIPEIEQQQVAAERLREMGIINGSESYLNAPRHLQFQMDLPHGSSPLALLQAALSKALCDAFLTSPYFLAKEPRALAEFETDLNKSDRTAAVDWRVQTVACLERMSPYDPEISERHARKFEQDFDFLLRDLDQESHDDLSNLFTTFAIIALKLWKVRTLIGVLGMEQFADVEFKLGSEHMDGEAATVSSLGQKLNGRPIGVIMRPLILSEPVLPEGRQLYQVVWFKALVWVSPEVDGWGG